MLEELNGNHVDLSKELHSVQGQLAYERSRRDDHLEVHPAITTFIWFLRSKLVFAQYQYLPHYLPPNLPPNLLAPDLAPSIAPKLPSNAI
ncbi:hypothetical protein Tco_0872372 [Tanacetum coccineum]